MGYEEIEEYDRSCRKTIAHKILEDGKSVAGDQEREVREVAALEVLVSHFARCSIF